MGEDDPAIGLCELSVDPLSAQFSAFLVFQDLIGSRSAAAVVEFDSTLQRCITADEGLGLGLVQTEVVDLSEQEAAACARSVGEVCQELLPEPASSVLLGAGGMLLALLAKRKAG
jgi:hypothetical protein